MLGRCLELSTSDSEASDLNNAGATIQMIRAGSTDDWEPVRPIVTGVVMYPSNSLWLEAGTHF